MTTGIAALLLASAFVAQAPVRDGAAAPATRTASIGGVISTETQPARPLRRAIVTLTAPDNAWSGSTVTDDAGRFVFTALPPGRYTLGASRPGWVSASYGARRPGRPGTSIQLEDGQQATVAMRLPRTAVVTGVVLDPNGQPILGLTVRAMRYSVVGGERRLVPAGTTSGPDERGTYRIYSLAPGEYFVNAASQTGFFLEGRELRLTTDVDVQQAMQAIQQGTAQQGGPTALDSAANRTIAFAPVYYPGTAAPAQATLLTLRAGEERTGVDFALPLVPTVRVEGTVSGPDGTVPQGTQVNLMTSDQLTAGLAFEGFRSTRAGADGKFLFADVAPGAYTVAARVALPQPGTARPGTSPPILWAATEVNVEGTPVAGLSLLLQPGLTMSGTVRFDGASAAPTDLSGARVNILPVISGNQVAISSTGATVDPSGNFTIGGLSPGRYRVNASLASTRGWTYRSTAIGGQDTLDRPIDIRASMEDVVVTFTDRPAQLDGKVQTAAAVPAPDRFVVLFPTDKTAWHPQSRRILSVRPSTDGGYSIKNLVPGEYLLAAVDDVEPGEWFDPAFLERAAAGAMRITIAEGEKKVQDIRVGGG
jgi:protocatechuate 3,4-dioxygenase beta subunit